MRKLSKRDVIFDCIVNEKWIKASHPSLKPFLAGIRLPKDYYRVARVAKPNKDQMGYEKLYFPPSMNNYAFLILDGMVPRTPTKHERLQIRIAVTILEEGGGIEYIPLARRQK